MPSKIVDDSESTAVFQNKVAIRIVKDGMATWLILKNILRGSPIHAG